jgi:hypothetical protein
MCACPFGESQTGLVFLEHHTAKAEGRPIGSEFLPNLELKNWPPGSEIRI